MTRFTIVRIGPPGAHRYFWRIRRRGTIFDESVNTFTSRRAALNHLHSIIGLGWETAASDLADVPLEVKL